MSRSFLILSLLLVSSAHAGDDAMFRGNLRHTGVYKTQPLARYRDVKWFFKTGGAVRSTPLFHEGTLYVGSADGHLYAMDAANGGVRWKFKTGGAVMSSPCVSGDLVLFTSRDGHVYALDRRSGKQEWMFKMGETLPYQWEFDYWLSSASVFENTVYVGGGDGFLYALDLSRGRLKWKFNAESRVRTSAAIADGRIFFGNMTGWMFALDAKTGTLLWKFGTEGSRINSAVWGFDRNSILSSAAISDTTLVFGGRDGFLYALDEFTGREKWRVDHKISWITGSPAIHEGIVYTGTSDGHFVQAVDLKTGQEKWRFQTESIVWSSPAVCDRLLYVVDNTAHVYALDLATGQPQWRFTAPGRSFSSAVVQDGVVYFGCDDGYIYALSGDTMTANVASPRKAVFWEKSPKYNYFRFGIDEAVRDYFVREGYERLDADALAGFMKEGINQKNPSVVVFAANRVPASVMGDTTDKALLRKYLDAGGRIVFLAPNPMAYKRDSSEQLIELSFVYPQKVLGIKYHGVDFDGFIGFHDVRVTTEGVNWGLREGWVGTTALDPSQVTTVLAVDENGRAAAWYRQFGGPAGSGLVQLWLAADRYPDFVTLRTVAEHGL